MTFEHITTWEAAVTYINAHSGMTEQQLLQLLHQMKVDAPAGAQVKMLYSGEVWGGKHSSFFIRELQDNPAYQGQSVNMESADGFCV